MNKAPGLAVGFALLAAGGAVTLLWVLNTLFAFDLPYSAQRLTAAFLLVIAVVLGALARREA